MRVEIGAYEAKTRLPELLREIQAGYSYTITNRGEAVADLVPAETARRNGAAAAVEQMRQLMAEAEPIRGLDVKALIEEGRA